MAEIKQGLTLAELKIGETLSLTEQVEDRQLLLYLGLTNDNNPLTFNTITPPNDLQKAWCDHFNYAASSPVAFPKIYRDRAVASWIFAQFIGARLSLWRGDLEFFMSKIDERKKWSRLMSKASTKIRARVLDASVMVETTKIIQEEGN